MRTLGMLALSLATLLVTADAFAAKTATRDKQARKACLSGDYAKGVSILTDLYIETGDATYLYNQGRCYEQNVRYVEAAERFREYLRKAPKLTGTEQAEVEKHIADCEVAIAKSRPPEPAPASQPLPPPVPQPAPAPPPPVELTQPGPAPVPAVRPWQRTAKWIATGAAVAFLGLGVAEHLIYYGKNNDYNDDPACVAGTGGSKCKDLADSADTAQIVSIVGYGAAAVATGLAVTFWLTDKPAAPSGQQAGLSVTCAPALAGVSCGGRF
jgi:tetratricopeptide (TPR) repeat protein